MTSHHLAKVLLELTDCQVLLVDAGKLVPLVFVVEETVRKDESSGCYVADDTANEYAVILEV